MIYIFETLADIHSTNKKIEILQLNRSPILDKILQYGLNPKYNYGIKQFPEHIYGDENNIDAMFVLLDRLNSRTVTGNAARDELEATFKQLNKDFAMILICILKRDFRCGVNAGLLRKAYGEDFIPKMPVMLASKMDEKSLAKIEFPAIAQIKYDGARCLATKENGKVILYTRNQKRYYGLDHIAEELSQVLREGEWADGELLFDTNRKASNGIANKSIKETISEEEARNAVYYIWDKYHLDSTEPYIDRFIMGVKDKIQSRFDYLNVAEYKQVFSMAEAKEYYEKCLTNGEEGIILKNEKGLWENRRSNNLVKFKDFKDADLRCIDWVEGTGKFKGQLGALVLESADGAIQVNVGTGFTEAMRESIKPDDVVGTIVEVKYNEIIDKKDGGPKSLFLPVFVEIRADKDEADVL